MPVLEAMLEQFPFPICGFHADNGSEYINHDCGRKCCNKLLRGIHQEPSVPKPGQRLVEGKNGAVIRKLIGYGHIAGAHAGGCRTFYAEHLNPYLNFHRPVRIRDRELDERGKRQRQIQDRGLPRRRSRKLQSLPERGELI